MKKILKKHLHKDDSGIAIMFSLMMLAVFLVLGMGFSAYMSNIRRAAEYQKQSRSSDDTMDLVSLQITDVIESGFEVFGSYPDDGTSDTQNYSPSMPEASPRRFDGQVNFTYSTDNGSLLMPDNSDNIEYPLWGVKTTDSTAAVDDSEIFFTMFVDDTSVGSVAEEKTDVFVDVNSFSSPDGGDLGWQVHKDFQGNPTGISTWALIGMSGRLDPTAYNNAANTPDMRAAGELTNEMSVADIISNAKTLGVITSISAGSSSLAGFHELIYDPDANNSNLGALDDTAYFSFFPMGSTYNKEMLNESDYLTTTDKAMTSDTDASNDVTLFNLNTLDTPTSANNEALVNSIVSGITYLPDDDTGKQIAANINDYIDGDSNSTLVGTEDAPTIMGNEKVPYINEIRISATPFFTIVAGTSPAPDTTTSVTLTFLAEIEYAHLYDITAITGTELVFTVDCNFDFNTGAETFNKTGTLTFTYDSTNMVSAGGDFSTKGYYVSDAVSPSASNAEMIVYNFPSDTTYTAGTVDNFTITNISTVVLKEGSNLWDIATPPTPPVITMNHNDTNSCSLECLEPKLNHLSTSWALDNVSASADWAVGGTGTGTAGTIGNKNQGYSITDGDNEGDAVNAPIDLSTNYIRNDKILNLHELGYIHRGFMHQTLNLIEYNTETPETIGSYTNSNDDILYNNSNDFADLSNGGDRSILDYVSLDGLEESTPDKGRINPNTYHPAVLKMLFSNISAEHPTADTLRVGELATANPVSDTKISSLIANFPGINSTRLNRTYHDSTDKIFPDKGYFDPIWFKNLKNNPPSYGIPFKLTSTLNDREAEVLLCNTRRFVSVNRNYYIASMVTNTATATDSASRTAGTSTNKIQYIVRELIDDAEDGTDPDRTPHTVSDDKYRARVMREF